MSASWTSSPTDDLLSLEQYARAARRHSARACWSTSGRGSVAVGPNVTWLFEDRLTIQYQVQEMLRAERIFEPEGIEEELGAYNPLIPDGAQLEGDAAHRVPGRRRSARVRSRS